MFVLLSHKLSVSTPNFAARQGMTITPLKEIAKGGSSNIYTLTLPNHLGTHIDAPSHFDPRGRPIASYSPHDFVFENPRLIDIPKEDSELIHREDLILHESFISRADLLLIRTGFQRFRNSDPIRYSTNNPGLSSSGASFLAEKGNLRALGLDIISVSSVQHREEGRKAHSILLTNRDFFNVEDMDLGSYPNDVKRVLAIPLFIEGVDSSPCTVLAEV